MKRERSEYFKAWKAAHPGYDKAAWLRRKATPEYREGERLRSARRRAEGAEKINEIARVRHGQRMVLDVDYRGSKARNALRWQKRNRLKVNAYSQQREFQKVKAVPGWGDRDHIEAFYAVAAAYRAMGVECEVDHVVPLRSKFVCGLHVSQNLQLLSPYLNKSKGNRHWPDHPNG